MKNLKHVVAITILATAVLIGCKKTTDDPILDEARTYQNMNKRGGNGGTSADTIFVSAIEVRDIYQIVVKGHQASFGFPTYVGEGALVNVVNNQGNPVSGVQVSGSFNGCFNSNKSATTNAQGLAILQGANNAPSGCTATFTVSSLSKSGAYYNAAANVVSSGSKVYP